MEDYEVKLAMQMISYTLFSSVNAIPLTMADVNYHLNFFFTKEVLDEAQKRLLDSVKVDIHD